MPSAKPAHDHAYAIDHLVDAVKDLSQARGGRMTGVRRDVLEAMSRIKQPRSAYQILATLNKKRSRKLSAMSLYRTLDFLIEIGVVIKLESQNAYQLCHAHGDEHSHLLMVCDQCGDVLEVDDPTLSKALAKAASKHNHKLKHHAIELHGVCGNC